MNEKWNLYYVYEMDIRDNPIPAEVMERAAQFLAQLLQIKDTKQ